jgi:hypothetical protein
MASPATRTQFKDYCLRRLGWPVININVDDEQVEDRIDDALQFFQDYHFNGCEKLYMKHKITQEDIDRRWIYCPDAVIFVIGVMPFDGSSSSINMFDLRYQLRLHDLYDFTSVSYVSYEITMQHIRTLNLLFSGTPQFRFNRHQNKVFLDINWENDLSVGEYVVIECYRKMDPDTITLSGRLTGNTSSNTVIGANTIFDQQIVENDFITLSDGQNVQVKRINSPTEILLTKPPTANVTSVTATLQGISDVWDDRFLKKYATALIKRQWGENMKKFGGIQMPGGVTLNGKEIFDEAMDEISRLEEDLQQYNVLPSDFIMG